jgi:aspartate/methionine/tyrosine aminotransferase
VPALRTFALERYFARWEFRAPHLLSPSDCEPLTVGELLALTGTPVSALTDLRLGYTESQGDPALRARIAAFYPGLSPDEILVTNAPEEAIFLAMHALLDPGDRVVVETPCYQSLGEIARHLGCDVQAWPLVETETGWRMDLDALDALLAPRTKLLVLNAPHNPTGHLPSAAEMNRIVALAEARGVRVFSDEMYCGLERDAAQRLAPLAARSPLAVSLWGMSKTFGLPGLRIGWLALQDRALLERLIALKDYTTICSSAPGELLARVALEHESVLVARSLAVVRENHALARAFAARTGVFAWREPLAGSVAFVRLEGGQSAQAFCDAAVGEAGIMVAPSTTFDFGDAHVRIGLGRKTFAAALAALEAHLASVARR